MEENQLDDAINAGLQFLEDQKSNASRYSVIRRVLEHTQAKLAKNESVEFSWKDIADRHEHESEGKTLTKFIKEAIKELEEQSKQLNQIALNNKYSFFPKLKLHKQGGGAGKTNIYKITAHSVDLEPLDNDIPDGHIRYKLETIADPNVFARLINNYAAEGYKFKLLVGGLTTTMLVAWAVFCFALYALYQVDTLLGLVKIALGAGGTLYGLYAAFSPLYHCLINRIIKSPLLLTPSNLKTAQLEYIATDRTAEGGRLIRMFRIVIYTATCPVCDGRIDIEKGKGTMKNRLVGCCSESPREHVFSFDHQTKSGKACFSEYESWNS